MRMIVTLISVLAVIGVLAIVYWLYYLLIWIIVALVNLSFGTSFDPNLAALTWLALVTIFLLSFTRNLWSRTK